MVDEDRHGGSGLDRAFSAFQQVLTCQGPQLIAANMDWSRFREIYEVRGPRPLLQELPRQPASAAATPLTRRRLHCCRCSRRRQRVNGWAW